MYRVLSDKTHAVFHGLKSGVAKSSFKFQALAICTVLFSLFFSLPAHATLLFTDDFTGYSGNLEANGWTKAGSGPVCVIASATPLTYTGYSSGGGNYVSLPTASSTTSRIYKGFTSTTAIDNTFYVSFLLRLSSATATGDYFISLGDPTTGTAYSPRLFAKSSGAGFVLGVSKNSATGTYGSTVYSFNTTYLVVMRLSGVTGTSNDTAYVWVNPGLSSEPATASAECSDTTGSDAAFTGGNVGNFHWHNRSANNAGGAFDGVRVSAASTSATAWSDLAIRPTINAVTLSSSLSGTYGTASGGVSFTASGNGLTSNITATAQTGYEVSTIQSSGYGSTVSVASGATVWVRYAATKSAGTSNGATAVVLSGGGASSTANVITSASGNSVSTVVLTITGLTAQNKNWDNTTTASVTGTAAFSGLVNGDNLTPGGSVSWAFADANVGTNKTLSRTGDYTVSSNYTVTQPILTANISAVVPSAPTITGITAGNGQLSVAFTVPSSNGGASITNYEYSTDGAPTWITPSPAVTASPLVITGLANATAYNVQLRAKNSVGGGTATASTQATPVAPSSPTITVAPATFASAFSTTYGTASSTQTFTVSGSTLNSDLTVTAPAGLEISLSSGSGYADSLTLSQTSGAVSSTTIYARLKATAAAGSYNSASIGVSGGGATAQSVSTTSSGNSVAAKALTLTGLTASDKAYDGLTTASVSGTASLTSGQVVGIDDVTLSGTASYSFSTATVGTSKPITTSGLSLSGASSANYSLTLPSLSAAITQAPVTITGLIAANKNYDAGTTVSVTGTPVFSGLVNSESFTPSGSVTWAFADATVGTNKTLVRTGSYSAPSANYSITQPSLTANISAVVPAAPTGIVITTAVVSGQLSVAFVAPTNDGGSPITNYKYSTNAGTTWTAVSPAATTSPIVISGLVNGTSYNVQIRAVNAVGDGAATATTAATPAAPPIWTNPITDSNPSALNPYITGDVKDSNVSVSGISRGSGITAGSASNRYNASGWNSTSLDANDYFQFTITPTVGYQVSLTSFVYTSQASTAAGMSVAVRSSIDGYTNNIGAATITGTTIDLSGASFQNISSPITFRLYAWGAGAAGNTFSVNDFSFNGSVGLVPTITINGNSSGSATAFTSTYGTPGTAQTFTIAGSNLTGDITATAPTGFEVSNDGTTYGSTATFTQTGGTASGSLRVRLAGTANVSGSYNSQPITLASTGATTRNITTASTGNSVSKATPTISVAPTASAITYGQTLASSNLTGGTASVEGTFAFTTPSTAPNAGTASQNVTFTPNDTANYNTTSTTVSVTVNSASLASSAITLTPAEDGSFTASATGVSGFSISYSGRTASGITTSYGPSSSVPTQPGFYTVTATSTDGNYSGSNSSGFHIHGVVPVNDAITKPAGNPSLVLTLASLLANDVRITSAGAVATDGLSITGVMNGSGNSAEIDGGDILFTPGGSSPETFTYVLSYGSQTAIGTVTVTTELSAPTFALQIAKVGTATYSAPNTTVAHDFIGVPNQTYALEYATDLNGTWTSAGNPSTGATGSFSVTITKSGDVAADWNAHMFFRARLVR